MSWNSPSERERRVDHQTRNAESDLYLRKGRLIMEYDMRLGQMAMEAVSTLTQARATQRSELYRDFLEKSAAYCTSLRNTYSQITTIPDTLPPDAQFFLEAVKQAQHTSPSAAARLEIVQMIEPLITRLLDENRTPNRDERLEIARGLRRSSVAAWE
jgi:hypothetical protein